MKNIIIGLILTIAFNCHEAKAQLYVKDNGRVGIGTSVPQRLFDVGGYGTIESLVYSRSSSTAARLWTCNATYSYGFGIDNDNLGHIYYNVNAPTPIMAFNSYGSVTVGSTAYASNYYKFVVYGMAYSSGNWVGSDIRLKKNITGIEGSSMEKIKKIRGTTYNLKSSNSDKKTYGFIAQELREVVPEVVCESDDSLKSLAVNYDGLIPILVEALKEQQNTIDELKLEIGKLQIISGLETNITDKNSENILYQNKPNPFNQVTIIDFFVKTSATSVMLNIYDKQGAQVKSIKIAERGQSSILISNSELKSGMYLYVLIVDGKKIDTKELILTD